MKRSRSDDEYGEESQSPRCGKHDVKRKLPDDKRKETDISTCFCKQPSCRNMQKAYICHFSAQDAVRISATRSRILTDDSPRSVYMNSKQCGTSVLKSLHFGQRKLLLSEIEFLTLYLASGRFKPPSLVVYAGAADGHHIPFLMNMFPEFKFFLADPASFHASVVEFARTSPDRLLPLHQGYFTNEVAEKIRKEHHDHDILFISDIRSYDSRTKSVTECTKHIIDDNELQRPWASILHAKFAMLKFHPPYANDKAAPPDTPYLDGICYFGVWAPKSSTEVRLIVSEETVTKTKDYNNLKFEEQLFHYNTNDRYRKDCEAEFYILWEYVRLRSRGSLDSSSATQEVCHLSADISAALGHPEFVPLERHFSEVRARQYYATKRRELSEND